MSSPLPPHPSKSVTRSAILCSLLIFALSSEALAAPQAPVFPEVKTYDELVQAIRETRSASRARIEQAVEQEKVREAWEIGKLIDAHILLHKERADYGKQVLDRLAKDLEMSQTELSFMLQFARAYPIYSQGNKLSWSHYRSLLVVNDSAEREAFARRAEKEGWGRDRLRAEIRRWKTARKPSEENVPESELSATPGKVGVCRVIRAKAGPFTGELALDLGFATYHQPKGIQKFKEGEWVQLEKGKLKFFKGSEGDRYTFTAYVSEVIDGDTFKAVIDLGFHIVTEQKLRLRGLDAPEIETAEGREAKEYLEKILKIGSPVLIRTSRSDKYDRYLADVWSSKTYVNQELINKRLAVRVSE